MTRHTCLALLALFLSACAYNNSEMICTGPSPCPFGGIQQPLDSGKDVQVLIVHGIGHHAPGYSDELLCEVGKKLRLRPKGEPVNVPLPDTTSGGVVRKRTFTAPNDRTLTAYEVTWSGVVDPLKARVLGYDATSDASKKRSLANGLLKRSLMNERLADPVLYLGEQQEPMRYPVRVALCLMMNGTPGADGCATPDEEPKEDVVMITESLGSRITFDTVLAMRTEEAAATGSAMGNLVRRISRVFMLANQLPLLDLADVTSGAEEMGATGGLRSLMNLRHVEEAAVPAMSVIAFSDPNDLLSYEIDPAFAEEFPEDTFTNIRIGVSGLGLFRLAANPLKAHVNYAHDPRVIEMIANGRVK